MIVAIRIESPLQFLKENLLQYYKKKELINNEKISDKLYVFRYNN